MKYITISVNMPEASLSGFLLDRLRAGRVTFYYKKKSTCELRVAHGTLRSDLIDYEFKTKGREASPGVITYWDLDREDWRSLRAENLISVDLE